ncbi:MAG: hypothetical protein ACRD01_09035 [Terriglobales bacterium]
MIADVLAIAAWSFPHDQTRALRLQPCAVVVPSRGPVSQPAPGSPLPPSVEPGRQPRSDCSLSRLGECQERQQAIAAYFLLGYEQAPIRGAVLNAQA